MGNALAPCATQEGSGQPLSSADADFLISVVRRFENGVTDGHLHTLLYVGQKLKLLDARYEFQFQQFVPFCEDLDLKIAMLLWSSSVSIRDNRIRAVPSTVSGDPDSMRLAGSLDKLILLSYDSLKFLAVALHLEQDLQKSRQEAVQTASGLVPVHEDAARIALLNCKIRE